MKTITAFSIVFLCWLPLFGQEQKKYTNNTQHLFDKAEYIFEGKMIEWKSFIDTTDRSYYSLIIINPTKVFRRDKKIGKKKIEMLIKIGGVYMSATDTIIIPRNHSMKIAKKGVYFCVLSNSTIRSQGSKNIRLSLLNSIEYNQGSGFIHTLGGDITFETIEEIYEFLRQHENITFPEGSE